MAKLTLHEDHLFDLLLNRGNSVILLGVDWDKVNHQVTFDIVGLDVPEVDEVVLHKITTTEGFGGRVVETHFLLKPRKE